MLFHCTGVSFLQFFFFFRLLGPCSCTGGTDAFSRGTHWGQLLPDALVTSASVRFLVRHLPSQLSSTQDGHRIKSWPMRHSQHLGGFLDTSASQRSQRCLRNTKLFFLFPAGSGEDLPRQGDASLHSAVQALLELPCSLWWRPKNCCLHPTSEWPQ